IRGRPVGPASDGLLFDLERTSDEDTQKAWRKILNRPEILPPKPRPVQVSVAYDNSPNNPGGVLVGSVVTQFPLVDINPFWSKIFAVFLIAAFSRSSPGPSLWASSSSRRSSTPCSCPSSTRCCWRLWASVPEPTLVSSTRRGRERPLRESR